jgi:hypothetical protein
MSATPILITQITSPEYHIHASWGPRTETPDMIAARFLVCVDRLKQIHPAYDDWISDDVNGRSKKLNVLRSDLPAAIAAKVARADGGDPTPIYGYRASAINRLKRGPRSLSLKTKAGAWVTRDISAIPQRLELATKSCPSPPSSLIRLSRRRSSPSSRVSTRPIVLPIRLRS